MESKQDKTGSKEIIFELNQVSLNRDKPILENINWQVKKGENWVILGRNGAGKTMLLQILTGYIWPSRGRVFMLGEEFGRTDLRYLRRRIGWVSAALRAKIPAWDTALNVVLSGKSATFGLFEKFSSQDRERAENLLESIGSLSVAGQKFGLLSQGEQQRILLARSLMPNPDLLILDEPCAGLDFTASEKFLDRVSELAGSVDGPTLLMVTHRISDIVSGITHGLLLHSGKLLAADSLKQVMTDELISRTLEMEVVLSQKNSHWNVERLRR